MSGLALSLHNIPTTGSWHNHNTQQPLFQGTGWPSATQPQQHHDHMAPSSHLILVLSSHPSLGPFLSLL
eukprot:6453656-Lingulodinium_polyedra.AAC.1